MKMALWLNPKQICFPQIYIPPLSRPWTTSPMILSTYWGRLVSADFFPACPSLVRSKYSCSSTRASLPPHLFSTRRMAFSVVAPMLWNQLPEEVVSSLHSFRRLLQIFLSQGGLSLPSWLNILHPLCFTGKT